MKQITILPGLPGAKGKIRHFDHPLFPFLDMRKPESEISSKYMLFENITELSCLLM